MKRVQYISVWVCVCRSSWLHPLREKVFCVSHEKHGVEIQHLAPTQRTRQQNRDRTSYRNPVRWTTKQAHTHTHTHKCERGRERERNWSHWTARPPALVKKKKNKTKKDKCLYLRFSSFLSLYRFPTSQLSFSSLQGSKERMWGWGPSKTDIFAKWEDLVQWSTTLKWTHLLLP